LGTGSAFRHFPQRYPQDGKPHPRRADGDVKRKR
jgi:hypothetical protein